MRKPHTTQTRGRSIKLGRGILWVSVSVALAIASAACILWYIRQPGTPSASVVSPVTYSFGNQTYQPGAARKYVIIEIEVKNPTGQPFNFAPVVQTYLTDAKGNRYNMAPTELSNPIAAGVVRAGETRRGQLSYNIPEGENSLEFHFVSGDTYHISYTQRL